MENESIPNVIEYPNIAEKMLRMVETDQTMRERSDVEDFWDESVDQLNTEELKAVIAEIGWPTISKVGKDGSNNAWLLVQHADHDVEFQKNCLRLMKEAPLYDVDPVDIAYLEDRVRVNEGKEQVYGTQFRQVENEHVPLPIEDILEVNARRAAVGMGPLEEQIEGMYEKYPFNIDD